MKRNAQVATQTIGYETDFIESSLNQTLVHNFLEVEAESLKDLSIKLGRQVGSSSTLVHTYISMLLVPVELEV